MALAPWIQEAKARALAAREGMKVTIDMPRNHQPYIAAEFTPLSAIDDPDGTGHIMVTFGEPTGGGPFWPISDPYAQANAELLAHAREDILGMVRLLEHLEIELEELQRLYDA